MKYITFPGTLKNTQVFHWIHSMWFAFFVHRSLKFSKRRRTRWRTASASPSHFMACKCCSLRISVSDVATFVEVLKASPCFKLFCTITRLKGKYVYGCSEWGGREDTWLSVLRLWTVKFGICSMRDEQRDNPVNHLHTWPTPAWR